MGNLSSKTKLGLGVGLGLLAAAGIGLLIYFLIKDDDASTSSPTANPVLLCNPACVLPEVCVNGKCQLVLSGKSACFDVNVNPGLPIADQRTFDFQVVGTDKKVYHTCLQIVNGGTRTMWITWLASEPSSYSGPYPGPLGSATGTFATEWTKALSNPKGGSFDASAVNWSWQNGKDAAQGVFELPAHTHVLLPYFGSSARIAGALDCSTVPVNRVDCSISRGGAPSPQTLVEWTWKPAPPDVIDGSAVDGYALPVRIEYLKCSNSADTCCDSELKCSDEFNTILGKFNESLCEPSGKMINADGSYAGCQSPCSAGIGGVPGVDNVDILNQVCCRVPYNLPCTCHPCTKLTGPAFAACVASGTACSGGIPVANAVLDPWIDSITTQSSKLFYTYAYDDENASITDQEKFNSLVKVTVCTDFFTDL